MLLLLELSKLLLFRLHEDLLEDELVLLLAFRGEGTVRCLRLLVVGVAEHFGRPLARPHVSLHERLVNAVDSLLLLLMLGDFLRSNDAG